MDINDLLQNTTVRQNISELILSHCINLIWFERHIIFQMQFSSIPTLIDAHVLSLLDGKPLKNIALFLFVASKSPLVLEDNAKIQLTASEDDLQAFIQSYDKISLGSNICLDNLEVNLELGKGRAPQHI